VKKTENTGTLIEKMLAGDIRSLSRLMTLVENSPEEVPAVMSSIYSRRKQSRRIGISGPPGAGKSTLLSNLVRHEDAEGKKVGVLCIDPTSPVSGGAILGDRVRMSDLFPPERVFIRSVASGDSLGGLAAATKLHTMLLEASGCDTVLIETVGLGQVGYDIAGVAESLVLVLVPESGDTIQILKSGILELADIIVVNKSDRDGAADIAETLKMTLAEPRKDWTIPVVSTIGRTDEGTDGLLAALDEHYEYLKTSGRLSALRDSSSDFAGAVLDRLKARLTLSSMKDSGKLAEIAEKVETGELDPFSAAEAAVDKLLGE